MEYDIQCDMECAMHHAMMLSNWGGGVDQITTQRLLLSIKLGDHAQQLRR